ncbi:MAG: hypothetical protein KIT58_02895 [Planctomycetota bacterium]|nr:hypothetical protein [Planctomycetota bacterium]
MDQSLRALHRTWSAQRTDAALLALLAAYRRADQPPPLELVRSSPRWRRLTTFTSKWYRAPLGDLDGDSLRQVTATETELGIELPCAVREWYLLVGRRIAQLQDHPIKLRDLDPASRDEGVLVLYVENQSVVRWGVRFEDAAAEDPPGYVEHHVGDGGWLLQHESVSELLLTLVLSETLIGSWSGQGVGALGPLAEGVRGMNGAGGAATRASLEREYSALPLPTWYWPSYPTRFFGDSDTLIRLMDDDWIEAATRSPGAWSRLASLLEAADDWAPADTP